MTTSSITVDEIQLLSFFAVQPVTLDREAPWPYTSYSFEVLIGGVSVVFKIEPAYRDVRLVVKVGDSILYDLTAKLVKDVIYHQDTNRETLEILVNDRDRLWLALRPEVRVIHDVAQRI
jgi:hypothetical protein